MLNKMIKVKAHLVLPKVLLKTVDRVAGKRKRSHFIAEATAEKLERENFVNALEQTSGVWSDEKHPDLKTKEDVDSYLEKIRTSYMRNYEQVSH